MSGAVESPPDRPLAGLYLHVPYCSAICPYCDFAVTTGSIPRRRAYAEDLRREMAMWSDAPLRFRTVYLGGGTPTSLPTEDLALLIGAARETFDIDPGARVSIEANPEDLTPAAASAWRDAGVGTISLGVQSFHDSELRFLCRRHDRRQAIAAVEVARAAGFETVSVDLIFGLPGQSAETWKRSLLEVGRLGVDHVSCYQLTIHEGTPFDRFRSKGRLVELDEDPQAELYALAHEVLDELGLAAYEVSNFARGVEHRSVHNMGYWNHSPYLGLGVSAHSFAGRERWWNLRGVEEWRSAVEAGRRPIEGRETLELSDLALEELLLALRTTTGIELDAYRRRYGVDVLEVNRVAIESLIDDGLLVVDERRLRPTARGLAVADGLARMLETGLRS